MYHGSNHSRRSCVPLISLLLLVLAAFGLRLIYVTQISLYIDEFTSIWAAKLILQRGLPLTPAGVIYHRGIFFSYVEAFSCLLFGFGEEASRMPSVFIACVTVSCLYLVGRRMLSDSSGLFAAAFLTFAPQAIIWGGRARMYALLQLLALLVVYFLYAGVVQSKRGAYQYWFVICFCGAVFAQEQAVLLYPALLAAVVALRRWRWFFERRAILLNAFCCLAILSRYLLDQVGRPTQFELVQGAGVSSGLVEGLSGGLAAYLSFFLHPDYFVLTVFYLLGLVYAIRAVTRRGKDHGPGDKRWPKSLAFVHVVFLLTILEQLLVGGERWSDARYFFMVLPLFMLGAAVGLDWAVTFMQERLRMVRSSWLSAQRPGIPSSIVVCSVIALIAAAYVPGVNSVLSQQIEGHDRAMDYVIDHWREGDVILMASPPVCAVYLDHCDYYAIQKAYEAYVIDRDGKTVDVWTGSPLLNSVDQLREVLRGNKRVWFVVDGWRLATRYELDLLRLVAEQMDLVAEVQGVKILLSDGYAPTPTPATHRVLAANLEDKVALVAYDFEGSSIHPQEESCLTLYWQALTPLDQEYTVFVHLVSREGSLVAQDDAAPMSGLYPTIYWQGGETVPDRHCFVASGDLAQDRYLLETGMYVPQTSQRLAVFDEEGNAIANRIVLDYLQVARGGSGMARPRHSAGANLGGQLVLLGYDVGDESSDSGVALLTVEPGAVIPVTLYWQGLVPMERDYTVFLHLLDEDGHIWGQADSQPDQRFYPTSYWDVGEIVLDRHEIVIDALTPEGDYRLVAGCYVLETGERLSVVNERGQVKDDKVFLGMIGVKRS